MTREELIKQVEALEYFEAWYHTGLKTVYIKDSDAIIVAWISNSATHILGTSEVLESYPEDIRKALLNILVEYAKTPIDERETKRYYVRYSKEYYDTTCEYLNIHEEFGMTFSPLKQAIEEGCQTSFAEEEIKQLREKYPFLDERFEQGYLFLDEIK